MLALVACPAVAHHDTPFDYDPRTPLRLESTLVRRDGAIDVHAISFDSPRGGRVTGKLFVPTTPRSTRLAGIVMAHGAPGSTANMDPRALFVARKGAVVIGIDAAFARRDPKDPITFTTRDADEQIQTIVDMRRAVDVLVARDDVDPARLGFIGGSYGAAMGGILAGVEDRLRAFVLAVGDARVGCAFHGRGRQLVASRCRTCRAHSATPGSRQCGRFLVRRFFRAHEATGSTCRMGAPTMPSCRMWPRRSMRWRLRAPRSSGTTPATGCRPRTLPIS